MLHAALLVIATCLTFVESIQTILATDSRVVYIGRHVVNSQTNQVHFDWVGNGFQVAVQGSTYVTANFSSSGRAFRLQTYVTDQGWVPFGFPLVNIWITPTVGTSYLLADSLNSKATLSVSSFINVPPQYWTGPLVVNSITTDGVFVAPPALDRNIEFVGDSITAATNVISHQPCADGGLQSSWVESYSALIGRYFNTSTSVIAVGGKGLIRNCCDQGERMPQYYLQTEYSSPAPYDFYFSNAPQAVVTALGTNDYAGIVSNSTFDAKFAAAYVEFWTNITVYYKSPNIQFFAVVGPMTNAYMSATISAISQATAAGLKVSLVNATGIPCTGCANHPGVDGHAAMANAAIQVISKTMGWQRAESDSMSESIETVLIA
jgi:lysophospholipase L1-like esterase